MALTNCPECASVRGVLKVRGSNRPPRYACERCDPRPRMPRQASNLPTGATRLPASFKSKASV